MLHTHCRYPGTFAACWALGRGREHRPAHRLSRPPRRRPAGGIFPFGIICHRRSLKVLPAFAQANVCIMSDTDETRRRRPKAIAKLGGGGWWGTCSSRATGGSAV